MYSSAVYSPMDMFALKANDWREASQDSVTNGGEPVLVSVKRIPMTVNNVNPPKLPPSAFTQNSNPNAWKPKSMLLKEQFVLTPSKVQPLPFEPSSLHDKKILANLEIQDEPNDSPDPEVEVEGETKQNLFKTEMCKNWRETGMCRYGPKCQFAHGNTELRSVVRHPKYKTEICRSYHTTGICDYGTRCRFVHHCAEMRTPEGDMLRDCNFSFNNQLAQLKCQLMSSPTPSLFSHNSLTAQDIADDVNKMMAADYAKKLEATSVNDDKSEESIKSGEKSESTGEDPEGKALRKKSRLEKFLNSKLHISEKKKI